MANMPNNGDFNNSGSDYTCAAHMLINQPIKCPVPILSFYIVAAVCTVEKIQ